MNISKKLLAGVLAALLILSAAGCASSGKTETTQATQAETTAETAAETTAAETTAAAEETGMRTVVDATGEEVQVPAEPKAIVITGPVFPNIVFALQGNMENVVAIPKSAYTAWERSLMRELAPEQENVNTTVVSGSGINMEELVNLKPDLVLCWASSTDTMTQLKELGIPVAGFEGATDMASLESLITMMGDVLNRQERAKELVDWYHEVEEYVDSKQDQVSALTDEQKPRILNITLSDMSVSATGMNAWITDKVGGQNIVLEGASAETSTPTMEEVLKYNPQIIFLNNWDDCTPEDVYENKIDGQDWSNVDAVINHRVYKIPLSLYRWTPPNTVEKPLFYLYMASMIQPDIFSEVDMRQQEKDFIQKFFDVTLTDEQLDNIFHVEMNQ